MKKKLNVLLALTDQLRHVYKNMVSDFQKFFNKSQGSFLGEQRTYTARDGMIDDPKKRGTVLVVTTVKEKLDYFIENSEKFIDALFSQEKTNASGNVSAELIIEGKSWGLFTSLELLRLKSLLESKDMGSLEPMLAEIPVRSDSEIWEETDNDEYSGREIYQTKLYEGVAKTTIKTPFILDDPNVNPDKLPANYQAPIVTRDEVQELGDYTRQDYSGEWTHRQRASALKRRSLMLTAITEALKVANEAEIIESELTAKRIFEYIFFGK
jgi:hypothetical protein